MAFLAHEHVIPAGMMTPRDGATGEGSVNMTTHPFSMTRAAWIAVLAGETECDACNGTGRIRVIGRHGSRACPACHGKGVPLTPRASRARVPERRVAA